MKESTRRSWRTAGCSFTELWFTHLPQSGSRPPKEGEHAGMLSYIHKVKNGRDIYYFANSSDTSVDTTVTLRGDLKLQSWDPKTGKISPLKTSVLVEDGRPTTKAKLELGPVTSLFFVEGTESK